MDATLGVIGLGEMGRPIARHWINDGYDVWVYDIDAKKTRDESISGATVAESPRALAAECDITLLMVGLGAHVEEVLFGEDGVADGTSADDIVVVSSTVHPDRCRDWAAKLPAGVSFIDAPVARGRHIERREAYVFAGGDEDAVDRARPYLGSFSEGLVYLGGTGTGQIGKTVNNLLFWACHVANYEALRLADVYGVDTDSLREGLEHSSGDNYALRRWGKTTGKWAEDDLRIVLELAEEYGVEMAQTERTNDGMRALDVEDIWSLTEVNY